MKIRTEIGIHILDSISIDTETNVIKGYFVGTTASINLGQYKSLERCKEILTEIQNSPTKTSEEVYMSFNGIPNTDLKQVFTYDVVYTMPKE